jgi:hypothetical protein
MEETMRLILFLSFSVKDLMSNFLFLEDLITYMINKNPINTISLSKDNEASRRRLRRRITNTLRKPTTQPTKLAEESELV